MNRNRTDLPAPFYAAAGAGDVAYQQLRRLPEVAVRTAEGLRRRFTAPDGDVNPVDLPRIRASAQRGTAAFAARAAQVQDQAAAGYRRLVARGERVMADRIGANPTAERAGIEVEVGPVQPAKPAEPASAPAGKAGTAADTAAAQPADAA